MEQALAALNRAGGSAEPGPAGDATLLPTSLDDLPSSEVEKLFGASFAKELVALPTGEWAGPVRSASGAHLVRLSSRSEKRVPPFAEVKDAVHRAWTAARRAQARDEYFDQTLKRYRVNVEAAR